MHFDNFARLLGRRLPGTSVRLRMRTKLVSVMGHQYPQNPLFPVPFLRDPPFDKDLVTALRFFTRRLFCIFYRFRPPRLPGEPGHGRNVILRRGVRNGLRTLSGDYWRQHRRLGNNFERFQGRHGRGHPGNSRRRRLNRRRVLLLRPTDSRFHGVAVPIPGDVRLRDSRQGLRHFLQDFLLLYFQRFLFVH